MQETRPALEINPTKSSQASSLSFPNLWHSNLASLTGHPEVKIRLLQPQGVLRFAQVVTFVCATGAVLDDKSGDPSFLADEKPPTRPDLSSWLGDVAQPADFGWRISCSCLAGHNGVSSCKAGPYRVRHDQRAF